MFFGLTPYERSNRAVASYDPFKEFDDFEKEFFGRRHPALSEFRTDIKETDSGYELVCDLPGFDKNDIRVSIAHSCLTISAERTNETEKGETDKNRYLCRERSYGSFSRSFDLSEIDEENVTARFENGVLTLNLPKVKTKPNEVRNVTIEG